MNKPRLLDLFAGAGGCSVGYHQAGFEVVGVDNVPQPRFPFEFHLASALDFPLEGYDAYHASPPCPRFSLATGFHPEARANHPDDIDIIRQRLEATGKPYIIENVVGAPITNAITLCGHMFGLRTYRHRLFESNILLFQPAHRKHTVKSAGPGAIAKADEFWCVGGHFGHKHEAAAALEVSWMSDTKEIANAIPPCYTKYIGLQLIEAIRNMQEVA